MAVERRDVYVLDIETNGLMYHQVRPEEKHMDKIHSIGIMNLETEEYRSYCDALPGHRPLQEAYDIVEQIPVLAGHNLIGFDLPVLEQYGGVKFKGEVIDTILLSQFFFGNLDAMDKENRNKGVYDLPKKHTGQHGLKAWGYRLDDNKIDLFGDDEESDWSKVTPEMMTYMEQDVRLSCKLVNSFWEKYLEYYDAVQLENKFAQWMTTQQRLGAYFDTDAAIELNTRLMREKEDCISKVKELFKPLVHYEGESVPKRDNKNRGISKGVRYSRIKIDEVFDPKMPSIARALVEQKGWEPEEFSEKLVYKHSGAPKPAFTDEIMSELELDGVEPIKRLGMLNKRLGMLSSGKNAWLKLVKDNRLHGQVKTLGTRSHRCSHVRPNLGQVTGGGKEYGTEMRQLFCAPPGWHFVNVDLSGIELRVFSHFLFPYDNGAYRDIVLDGDVHTHNQKAAGLPTRAAAKGFIYSTLYGAGPGLIGRLLDPDASATAQEKLGGEAQRSFKSGLKGFKELDRELNRQMKMYKGRVKLWDGRLVPVDSKHKRLNCALQGSAGIYAKLWAVYVYEECLRRWGEPSYDGKWVLQSHVHDEFSIVFRDEADAKACEEIAKDAVKKADAYFSVKCPNDIGFAIGKDWSVH